jgi:hypothetical protein
MVIYERPNALQLSALGLTVLAYFVPALFPLPIIAWSAFGWDELRYGHGPFRRAIGAVVWIGVAVWLFRI